MLCVQFTKALLVHDFQYGLTLANLGGRFGVAIEILADPRSVEIEGRADNTEQGERANHGADNDGNYGPFVLVRRIRGKEPGKGSGGEAVGGGEFGGLALSSVGIRVSVLVGGGYIKREVKVSLL